MSLRNIVLTLILSTQILSCQSTEKAATDRPAVPDKNADPANWPVQMQNMAEDVKRLLPYLYSREEFRNPANRERILHYLKDFARTARHVQPEMGKKILGDDLLVESALSSLSEDLNRAVRSFDAGQVEYSRSVAKASLGYCFQCHSVTHEGASAAWDLNQLQAVTLAPVEKADLLVAARKYDQALDHMEKLLDSSDFFRNHAFDFESILRRYLAVVIRVEKNPQRAVRELDKISRSPETPQYIQEQIEGWQKSFANWEREKPLLAKTPRALFEQVEGRFKKAASLQHFEKDHAGDVEYLRATEQLHQGLKILKAPADKAHALFLLGRAYEVLDELGSWNLHETYYEACIHKDPKSPFAKRCLGRLEASLYMGYSGSSGTHLPPEEKERLKVLREKIQAR